MNELKGFKKKYSFIKEVRGKGLLVGMELDIEGADIVSRCMERGFLLNCAMGTVLRFLPPLIVTMEETSMMLECLDGVLGEL
jgi:acetylornithine/succinyldiaminopimelate/putrescine aminotransferase